MELDQEVKTLKFSVSEYEKHVTEQERELELLKVDSSAEIVALRQQIDENVAKGAFADFKICFLLLFILFNSLSVMDNEIVQFPKARTEPYLYGGIKSLTWFLNIFLCESFNLQSRS